MKVIEDGHLIDGIKYRVILMDRVIYGKCLVLQRKLLGFWWEESFCMLWVQCEEGRVYFSSDFNNNDRSIFNVVNLRILAKDIIDNKRRKMYDAKTIEESFNGIK